MDSDTRHSDGGADTDTAAREREVTRRELHGTVRRSWRRRLVIGLVTALVLVVGGGAFAAWKLNGNITKIDVSTAIGSDRPEEVAGTADAVNLLLVGSDTREGDGNDAYGDNDGTVGGAHSDTNLLVHVSADRSWATVVSIPRDSMTPAPPDCSPTAGKDSWRMRMWNQNYRIGGTGCLIRTLEGNTGLRIDHYAVVDFRGFKTMVDALGGVEVCTSQAISDKNTHLELTAGRHTLDGRQALQYVRARKSIGDGSDLGRIQRQQAFLSSVMQEATSTKLLFQPTKLFSFLDAATTSLTTDPEFGLGTMQDLASSVKGIGLDKIQFVTVPNETYPLDTNRVQWKASATQIWTALREDHQLGTPGKTPTPTATPSTEPLTSSPADIKVTLVNSSGVPGLARQARDGLQVQGFAGITTSNGSTGPTGALVEYSGDHAEDARTVAAAFPEATVKKVSGLGSTVRVTLGKDAPDVVELPNRLGTEPLPTPSIAATPTPSESIQTRTATTDICS
ncbi:LCP family protein [Oryzobacter telluris]|uniref:LCP family protein n=1 Tax=Oryzobacter telluris TaxID=3149179 RepID=UPI00370D6840